MSSVFEGMKDKREWDGNSGNFELKYLYLYENIDINQELELRS